MEPHMKIIGINDEMPQGYRWITFDEAQDCIVQIIPLLDSWSMVALQTGKIGGFEYDYQIYADRGDECKERLIVRIEEDEQKKQPFKQDFKIIGLSEDIPEGYRWISYDEAQFCLDQFKPLLDEWSIVAFQTGKIGGRGYNYQVNTTYGDECGERLLVSKDFDCRQQIDFKIVKQQEDIPQVFRIIGLDQEIPNGYRWISYEEAQLCLEQIKPLLTGWSIVAFQTGKIGGPWYDYKVDSTYGDECGERLIVRDDFDAAAISQQLEKMEMN